MPVATEALTCASCGAEHGSDARFCGACGALVTTPARCAACGVALTAAARSCGGCGVRVRGARPTATATPSAATTPSAKAPELLRELERRAAPRSNILGNVLVFAAVLVGFVVFTREWNQGKEKEASMFGGAPPAASLPSPAPVAAGAGDEVRAGDATIAGTVALAAGSAARPGTLFVVVRASGGPERGPPLAVKRVEGARFPVEFQVGPGDVMIQGMPFTGPFDVSARLDGDGNAMTRAPEDLVAPTRRGVALGARGLALELGPADAAGGAKP
jgi:hypothetical protein